MYAVVFACNLYVNITSVSKQSFGAAVSELLESCDEAIDMKIDSAL